MSGDENMSVTLLVSALKKDPDKLIEDMHIASDAVIVDQCDNDSRREIAKDFGKILVIESTDRGVGNNRNLCIDNSFGDIVLFGDDDIVYDDDYAKKVSDEFEKHPEADLITFNVSVCEERRTYVNEGFKKLSSMNIGRYPAYSIAVKRDVLIDKKVRFSPLFGGGAKYSNGEDSLFLKDAFKRKWPCMRPMCISAKRFRENPHGLKDIQRSFSATEVCFSHFFTVRAHGSGDCVSYL